MKRIIFLVTFILLNFSVVEAAYLKNVPQTLVQPNGDTLRCFASGDEFHNWLHDAEGYTIVRSSETGYYVYADKIGGEIAATDFVAGQVNPAEVGLTPFVNISAEEWLARRTSRETQRTVSQQLRDGATNHGTLNNLVIFIRFADDEEFTQSFPSVQALFNADENTTASLYGYFKTVSYNQLEIISSFYPTQNGSTILSYQDIYPHSYFQPLSASNPNGYASSNNERNEREHSLLARAVSAIATQIPASLDIDFNNDGLVDNIVFVVKGAPEGWNDLLWPHQWDLPAQQTPCVINGKQVASYNFQLSDAPSYFNVGVFCHEMNHTLGAPDLYHYYNGTGLVPVGAWDLMGQNGSVPQNMGAYMKHQYGNWINSIPEITECGMYTLHSLGSSATNNCYKIASPDPDVFYLLEYRNQNDLYDSSIPTSGLLIYRIDTRFDGCAYYNGSTRFDEIYIFRPNGTPSVNGSVGGAAFASNLNKETFNWQTNPKPFLSDGTIDSAFCIHQVTAAGGDSISFTFCPQNYLSVSPAEITLGMFAGSSQNLTVSSDMAWAVICDADWLSCSTMDGWSDTLITISALTENTNPSERTCTLTIIGSSGFQRSITVSQLGNTPYLAATFERDTLDNNIGDSTRVFIESNTAWTATALNDWATLSQNSGLHNDTITLSVNDLNSGCSIRAGTLTFLYGEGSTRSVTFRQRGSEAELEITAPSEPIANEVGSQATFDIHANAHWSLYTASSWLSFSATSGDTDATVTATATHTSSSATERSALVRITTSCGISDTFRIYQMPAFIHLSENSIGFGCEAGDTYALQVSSSGSWNANTSSLPDWLEVAPVSGHNADSVFITTANANAATNPRSFNLEFQCGSVYDYLNITQSAVGIDDENGSPIRIHPNPARDQIRISLPGQGNFSYQLFNAQGSLVSTGILNQGNSVLELQHQPAGLYLLRIIDNENKASSFKIVAE